MKRILFGLTALGLMSICHAASFDCRKASTFIEKAICSDPKLSDLDDSLIRAYRHALTGAADTGALQSKQVSWLSNVRNKCQDTNCLSHVYSERIVALNAIGSSDNTVDRLRVKNIVSGRCHMNVCWWWQVQKKEITRSETRGTLFKVQAKTTSEDFTDTEVDKLGYADFPKANAAWSPPSESFIYCSDSYPAYMEYDSKKQKYIATEPFDQDGNTYGATEGVGNLYYYVCNTPKNQKFNFGPEGVEFPAFENPSDIFSFAH